MLSSLDRYRDAFKAKKYKHMKRFLLIVLTLSLTMPLFSQGYAFGIKGGLTVGTQKWDNTLSRDALFSYHGIAFIESISDADEFALFAQAGYHVKGSAIRNRNFVNALTGNVFRPDAQAFKFNNISLTLGAKQKFDLNGYSKWYWLLGIRGDYTVSTNLDEYSRFNERNPAYAIYPFDEPTFIRDINYGVTVGAGLQLPMSDYIAGILEFSVNPDFSFQYEQPEIPNVTDPYTGNTRTIPQRQIRNLTFELTLGLRFLHEIEYID